MSTVIVSKKGWVVIPRDIRQRYRIKAGDRVQVLDCGGHVAIVPAMKDPIREFRGLLRGGPSLTEALLEEREREREREEAKLRRWAAPGQQG